MKSNSFKCFIELWEQRNEEVLYCKRENRSTKTKQTTRKVEHQGSTLTYNETLDENVEQFLEKATATTAANYSSTNKLLDY